MNRPPLYPLFLKLDGHRCVVVGGGHLAARKGVELLLCGARVVVVAPELGEEVAGLARAHPDRVELRERAFEAADAEGARLLVAATDDEAVNRAAFAAGRAAGALVNVVDVVDLCDFYTGGVVRRGPLQIVVGTSGASPSLARRVRLWLEDTLPAGLGPLAAALGSARPRLLERYPSFKERAHRLDAFVARAVERIRAGDDADWATDWIEDELFGATSDAPLDGAAEEETP